jgi:hypothetical protein
MDWRSVELNSNLNSTKKKKEKEKENFIQTELLSIECIICAKGFACISSSSPCDNL